VGACLLGGAFLGGRLQRVLPEHHLSAESKESIKIGTGLIATLVALVLGLLVASAKSSFDAKAEEIREIAAKVVQLDRTLRQLGPRAAAARRFLREAVESRVRVNLGELGRPGAERRLAQADPMDDLQEAIQGLQPADERQRFLQGRALGLVGELSETRWLLVAQKGSSVSMPLVVVVVLWLAVIFTTLGLFAPPNGTVRVITVLCALSASTAVFLILELDRPFGGVLQISREPLRIALGLLDS
jgi:hypothetical protein